MAETAPDSFSKVEVHRYALKSRAASGGIRTGSLLRVTFKDLPNAGVADLFPWNEYGDPPLETWIEQLKQITRGAAGETKLDPTVRRAIEAARDEALAVSQNRPLIQGSVVNHALSTDPVDLAVGDVIAARRGTFPAIKIKIGKHDAREEAAALSRLVSHWGIRLRLDANERTSRDELMIFLDALPIRIRETLEFIEDPFKFDHRAWSDFHRETEIPIAYDMGHADHELKTIFDAGAAQVLVHKPAWQNNDRAIFARERGIPVVVTSILGHPIGNLWAASKAAELEPDGVHGTMSHVAYKDDDASKTLVKSKQARGSRMVGIGVGLGLQSKWFDRLRWETL